MGGPLLKKGPLHTMVVGQPRRLHGPGERPDYAASGTVSWYTTTVSIPSTDNPWQGRRVRRLGAAHLVRKTGRLFSAHEPA